MRLTFVLSFFLSFEMMFVPMIAGLFFIGITFVIHHFKSRVGGIVWGLFWSIGSVFSYYALAQAGEFDLRTFLLFVCYGIAYCIIFFDAHKKYKKYLLATASSPRTKALDK